MQQVRTWLFIGKYSETLNRDLLDRSQIQAILQLAAPVEHQGIEVLYLPVDDGVPLQPEMLASGVAFIRREYAQGNHVMVACGAGISRSVTFAIASLKEEEDTSLLEAFRAIAAVHPAGMPHPELWQSLCAYYDEELSFLEMWRQIRKPTSED